MFLVTFGGDAAESIIRSDLVSGCEDILRASPEIVEKIRKVLINLEMLTEDEIDAALHDPTIVAEFAISTADDISLVNSENGVALLEIIKKSATKDAELRFLEEKRESDVSHADELQNYVLKVGDLERKIGDLLVESGKHTDHELKLESSLNAQRELTASIMAVKIERDSRLIWRIILSTAVLLSLALAADFIWHFSGIKSAVNVLIAILLSAFIAYSFLIPFFPKIEPRKVRAHLVQRAFKKSTMFIEDDDILEMIASRLGVNLIE